MKIVNFDWDQGNSEKIKKHGINLSDIEEFFLGGDPFVFADSSHSLLELRFIAFGNYKNRNIFVAFTFRAIDGLLKIRVISARYAHKNEAGKFYEKKRIK